LPYHRSRRQKAENQPQQGWILRNGRGEMRVQRPEAEDRKKNNRPPSSQGITISSIKIIQLWPVLSVRKAAENESTV
jgi:hypothetical protein